jgi:hypothetical protein
VTHRDPDPGSELEAEGVPDMSDVDTPQRISGDTHEMIPPPGDEPGASVDFGTTAEEERQGESLDGRLAREEPDRPPRPGDEAAHRFVAPDEGVREDTESDAVGYDVGRDTGDLSAEEAAVHEEPEP